MAVVRFLAPFDEFEETLFAREVGFERFKGGGTAEGGPLSN